MLELVLENMTCGHCVATVKQTLQQLDPQAQVEVDLPRKTVRVDTSASDQQVRQALAEEGYPAA